MGHTRHRHTSNEDRTGDWLSWRGPCHSCTSSARNSAVKGPRYATKPAHNKTLPGRLQKPHVGRGSRPCLKITTPSRATTINTRQKLLGSRRRTRWQKRSCQCIVAISRKARESEPCLFGKEGERRYRQKHGRSRTPPTDPKERIVTSTSRSKPEYHKSSASALSMVPTTTSVSRGPPSETFHFAPNR